ncbi:MAG: hypothetical protein M3Y48_10480 [Actinomycetota bacterium]|nr:hypothetical protein [Actinomycetota bacterium]
MNLLLNDEMADGLQSARLREKVERVEELLDEKKVRDAVVNRSQVRNRRILAAARAIQNEEISKARTTARIQEQDLRARLAEPEFLAKLAERFIRANATLARMTMDLLDLQLVIDKAPDEYRERTISNLEQIQQAAGKVLAKLRPEARSPQPCTIIDMHVDD